VEVAYALEDSLGENQAGDNQIVGTRKNLVETSRLKPTDRIERCGVLSAGASVKKQVSRHELKNQGGAIFECSLDLRRRRGLLNADSGGV
jgi:hypothetical protein